MKARGCNFYDKNLEFFPFYTFENLLTNILIEGTRAPWLLTLISLLITAIVGEMLKPQSAYKQKLDSR